MQSAPHGWRSFKQPVLEEAPLVFEDMPSFPEDEKDEPRAEELQKTDEVAALTSRSSVFGATDIEQDEAEFKRGTTDSLAAEPLEISDIDFSHQEGVEDLFLAETIDAEDETSPDHVPLEKKESLLLESEASRNDISQQEPEEKPQIIEEAGAPKTYEGFGPHEASALVPTNIPPLAKNVIPKEHPQKSSPKKRRRRKATRNNTGIGTKNASPIKKELTFNDMAQGFLELMGKGGQDWLDRTGNPNIRPDFAEMKKLHYVQRVYWHLQNECKIRPFNPNPGWVLPVEATITLIFNKEGTITDLFVTSKSGYDEFDTKVKDVLRLASPCPPIPTFLGADSMRLAFTYKILAGYENKRIRYSYF